MRGRHECITVVKYIGGFWQPIVINKISYKHYHLGIQSFAPSGGWFS